jgi:hypothetical protein
LDQANYIPLGVRLAQGDIVRAPTGVFVRSTEVADQALLAPGKANLLADANGIALPIPNTYLAGAQLVLRAWYMPAVVVSPSCALEKQPPQVLISPILPLSSLPENQQAGVRARTYLTAYALPGDAQLDLADGTQATWPDSYVDLHRTTAVSPHLLRDARMVALSPDQVDRLHEAWVRFVALAEISSTGTVAAAQGRRLVSARTAQTSARRHTVLLTFDDGGLLVLYQDPRRAGANVQSVHVQQGGAFDRAEVTGRIGEDLILRFENDTTQDWEIACPAWQVGPRTLPSGSITDVLVQCPPEPSQAIVRHTRRIPHTLRITVSAPRA